MKTMREIVEEREAAEARHMANCPNDGMQSALTEALAWYYADLYDGPESRVPEWVGEAREALADVLVGDRDARTRHEAVEAALEELRRS